MMPAARSLPRPLGCLLLALLLLSVPILRAADQPRILYDDTHGQTAGNADWIITGAYSEMADTLTANGFVIDSLSKVSEQGRFTSELLANYQAVILAEPNNAYREEEAEAIVQFVLNGGGAFLIGDHGGADRDGDGVDAVIAFNAFCPRFGFSFAGDYIYEAPVAGPLNKDHPVMFGVRAVGAWAGSTFVLQRNAQARAVGLIESRHKKAPYIVAAEAGKGRVVAIGDSSPFDDGIGSGAQKKLHDSYDSFMYSHPQLAYNALVWVTGGVPARRIPSKRVPFFHQAKASEKARNILIDAAHGNAASDKMETFERHMRKLGFKVFYTLNLLTPEMLSRFSIVILPNPSLPLMASESKAIVDWFMAGGRLVMAGDWDSSKLDGRRTLNALLEQLGSVVRLNSDQIWDHIHKTNKPWGVLATVANPDHPVTKGIQTVITWGTCSLISRQQTPLAADSGIELLVVSHPEAFNKDGDKRNDAILYPPNSAIPIMALERLANGILVIGGCNNFTDYQYPDSDLNQAQPGPNPFVHQTGEFYDNLIQYLARPSVPPRSEAPRSRR